MLGFNDVSTDKLLHSKVRLEFSFEGFVYPHSDPALSRPDQSVPWSDSAIYARWLLCQSFTPIPADIASINTHINAAYASNKITEDLVYAVACVLGIPPLEVSFLIALDHT